MHQSWHDLLFAHWPVPVDDLRRAVPASLPLDTFNDQAWVGVVPFRMSDVYPRYTFSVPGLSAFPELNVRTYVVVDGKPGVYFFSLDAANPLAVRLARSFFHLPYFDAHMSLVEKDGWIEYRSHRTHNDAPGAELVCRYRPVGDPYLAQHGSLEEWLTERYCMYPAGADGRLYRGEIHHAQWSLQPAAAEFETNTMVLPHGLQLPHYPPILHFARRLEVVVWGLERLKA
jgi:hypothetical protein